MVTALLTVPILGFATPAISVIRTPAVATAIMAKKRERLASRGRVVPQINVSSTATRHAGSGLRPSPSYGGHRNHGRDGRLSTDADARHGIWSIFGPTGMVATTAPPILQGSVVRQADLTPSNKYILNVIKDRFHLHTAPDMDMDSARQSSPPKSTASSSDANTETVHLASTPWTTPTPSPNLLITLRIHGVTITRPSPILDTIS